MIFVSCQLFKIFKSTLKINYNISPLQNLGGNEEFPYIIELVITPMEYEADYLYDLEK